MSAKLFSALTFVFLSLTMAIAPSTASAQASTSGEPLIVEADDSLEWHRDKRQYIAKGNAVATQGETTLSAQTITADYRENTAATDEINITRITGMGKATLIEPGYRAVADTIEYNLETNKAQLVGGIVSIIADDGTITAKQTIIYDRGQRQLTATGAAEVNLTNGQRLTGDRIEVDLDAAERDFTTIRAFGNAEVFSPEIDRIREARAENITYIKASGIAVLTDAVEIIDGGNRMTGDKAEIDTISGISTMTSTSGRVGGVFTP